MAHIAIGEAEGLEWLESAIGPGARVGSAEELVPEAEGEMPTASAQAFKAFSSNEHGRP